MDSLSNRVGNVDVAGSGRRSERPTESSGQVGLSVGVDWISAVDRWTVVEHVHIVSIDRLVRAEGGVLLGKWMNELAFRE